MEESLTGTRVLSARRSKPDMAALVDQHRLMNAYIPVKRPEMIFDDRIPVVSIESLNSDDSASSTYSPEPQTFVIRKRISTANEAQLELTTTPLVAITHTSDEESDDADDNVPLSNFVPVKPTPQEQQSPPSPDPAVPYEPEPKVVLCPCTKPAVLDDPRWDGQYCSPECLISGCHRAFEGWLRVHRASTGISGC